MMDISKADFQLWRHHPVSKVFLKYLADKRAFVERAAIDQWVAGSLSLVADQTIRGQIIELYEIENLPFEAIDNFYRSEEESDGAEASQDVSS